MRAPDGFFLDPSGALSCLHPYALREKSIVVARNKIEEGLVMTSRARLTCLVGAAVVLAGRATEISKGQEKITYNREVRPILSNNCFLCHGRDEKNRKAKLRLDLRESATKPRKDGSPAIVPGKPDDSALVRRIFAEDETEIMPPPQSHKQLSVKEKETLKRWIAEGAEYQDHWAYITPTRIIDQGNQVLVKVKEQDRRR